MQITLITLASLILVGLIFIFNRFVRYRNNVNDAWSNIDVYLKKRHELIPNLVNTVKGYALHEQATFIGVTEARSAAMNVPENDTQKRELAEKKLSGQLNKVLILQENYPDLKANNSFLKLQNELGEIEGDLEKARRYYNATVRENNTFGESFPANLFTKIFGYKQFDFFSIQPSEKETNQINF